VKDKPIKARSSLYNRIDHLGKIENSPSGRRWPRKGGFFLIAEEIPMILSVGKGILLGQLIFNTEELETRNQQRPITHLPFDYLQFNIVNT
jgi:hypothetical protein